MISVIMSTYNEPLDYIRQSIKSILAQTYRDIEFIIVVDNPKRKDLIVFLNKFGTKDQRIKILVNKTNIGLASSLNRGLALAKGDYIARMDADDYSLPNRLEKQLTYLIDNGLDLVGCNIINMDMNGKVSDCPTFYPRGEKMIRKFMHYSSPMAHPTWLGKAEVFKNNEYIDFFACEDYEFLARILLQGKKIDNMSTVLLKYRINKDGISSNKKAIQKTSLLYISKDYKNGKTSVYSDYLDYLSSKDGKIKQQRIADYYRHIAAIKNDKSIMSKMENVFLLFNSVSYRLIYSSLRIKRLRNNARSK